MKRILIIGCGGAGKSTLARQLGEKTGLPVVHLDKLWWRPGWQAVSREEFDRLLTQVLEQPRWIMDGNFNHTMPQRLEKCDTIIYLDFSRFACLCGVFKRILTTYGQVRPDMGAGCPERLDMEFLQWVWNFNKKNRARNYAYLADTKHAKVIVLKNRREVRAFLASLPTACN